MRPADLADVPTEIWRKLAQADGPWRTPVLASVTAASSGDVRTVVLRDIAVERREVVFFTDRRSRKLPQLTEHPGVCLLIYDEAADWQVRLYGSARPADDKQALDDWWASLAQTQRAHYEADAMASAAPKEKGRENFAAFVVTIERLHCLWLYQDGNEAAEFEWQAGHWNGRPARP